MNSGKTGSNKISKL